MGKFRGEPCKSYRKLSLRKGGVKGREEGRGGEERGAEGSGGEGKRS